MASLSAQLSYSVGKYRIGDSIVSKPYYAYLPDDTVEYHFDAQGQIEVTKILNRKEQITLGIIDEHKIHYPLLTEYFTQWIPNNYEKGTRCQIYIAFNNIQIIKTYPNISDRSSDTQILREIYLSSYTDPSAELQTIVQNFESISFVENNPEYIDQTGLYTFNIDPPFSRDFDDAISIDVEQQKVYVHIVDINSQIQPKSDEDIRAFCLGFTLYLPSAVENILPPALAENELSLIKGEPRKVITVEFDISADQPPQCVNVYPSMIIIKDRFDYNNVLEPLTTDANLAWLYSISSQYFRPTLMLPTVKLHLLNESVTGVTHSLPNVANKLVETWMIFTNKAISEFLQEAPQRHHPRSLSASAPVPLPSSASLSSSAAIPLSVSAPVFVPLSLSSSAPISLSASSDIIDTISILKTYKNAYYSGSEAGHYGLQLHSYTHFTSPIRRYFDVIIHRMLAGTIYPPELLTAMLAHLKEREKLVDDLAVLYKKWKIFGHIESQTSISGRVLKVMPSGITVLLDDYLLESYIHVSKIRGKRWSFGKDTIVCENDTISVGDNCSLKINGINWFAGSLDLSVV